MPGLVGNGTLYFSHNARYSIQLAFLDLFVHKFREGYKITKKGSFVFFCVFIIALAALIVSDCLLQDCLRDI